MKALLENLYSNHEATVLKEKLDALISRFRAENPELAGEKRGLTADQSEVLLIAYGDQVRSEDRSPLLGLKQFMEQRLEGITGLHLLPHFPYSSDDGFSVIDYLQVDPALGTWDDVRSLSENYSLMFDAVINHISAQSDWFKEFLDGTDRGYFKLSDPSLDHSLVTRPRTHPLLTAFETKAGPKHLWTTFSTDQIDLDYANPELFLKIVEILLEYARQGARYLRLDAVGFLWKELGTTCMHLPQTHQAVKLLRKIFDEAAPGMVLVPEINGSYEENAPYFGNGYDEAQMVYNFPLPPMVLHTFHTGDSGKLSDWLSTLSTPSDDTTFFNFLSSHDGIGVRPVDHLLEPAEVEALTERVRAHGGEVSNRLVNGEEVPYELNITFYDALTAPDEPVSTGVNRMRCSHAILLALAGIPGIYFNSLVGCPSWREGLAETGRNRTLNRRKFTRTELDNLLERSPQMGRVREALLELIEVRGQTEAFHPQAPQEIQKLHPGVVAIKRGEVLALHNIRNESVNLRVDGFDLITRSEVGPALELEPYGVRWLKQR